nr:waprin-Enh1-like [Anolis sagrei ordinatus]
MQTLKNLLFVSIFILWVELPPAILYGKISKPGFCPIDLCRCTGPQPDRCKNDYSCGGKKKCCMFCCAMQCKEPVKVRPGQCPPNEIVCVKAEKDECQYDINCPSPQKCCYNFCANRCVNPV